MDAMDFHGLGVLQGLSHLNHIFKPNAQNGLTSRPFIAFESLSRKHVHQSCAVQEIERSQHRIQTMLEIFASGKMTVIMQANPTPFTP